MRKNILLSVSTALILILALSAANAQVSGLGVRIGANFSNIQYKDFYGNVLRSNIQPGFHAGITYDLPLSGNLYLQPGALFTTKGYSFTKNTILEKTKTNFNPYYLEIPVNILLKPQIGQDRLLVGLGPFVAYGIGGNYKKTAKLITETTATSTNGKIEFINDRKDAKADKFGYGKKLDYGLNILGGYEFSNNFSVQLNGQWGLSNIEPDDNGKKSEYFTRNIGFGLSVGYKF